MDTRLSQLLRTVVDEYVSTGEPVGSQSLVEKRRLAVSPATIRHWFAALEAGGYLVQPHTSGGRLPTEKGFRFYVKTFVTAKPPNKHERDAIARILKTTGDRRIKQIAKTLSDLTGLAAVVGWKKTDTYYTGLSLLFAQPEFRDWQRVVSLTEVLDRLDDALSHLRQNVFPSPEILLGRECPFGSACGVVIGSTGHAMIGILGPMRMDYQRALSLMMEVTKTTFLAS